MSTVGAPHCRECPEARKREQASEHNANGGTCLWRAHRAVPGGRTRPKVRRRCACEGARRARPEG
eukprot:9570860-Alexandrium_andersonii.AAC.1